MLRMTSSVGFARTADETFTSGVSEPFRIRLAGRVAKHNALPFRRFVNDTRAFRAWYVWAQSIFPYPLEYNKTRPEQGFLEAANDNVMSFAIISKKTGVNTQRFVIEYRFCRWPLPYQQKRRQAYGRFLTGLQPPAAGSLSVRSRI